MARFLVRRFAFAVALLVCAASASFLLTRAAPGDLTGGLGQFVPADEIAAARSRYGLDKGPLAQLGSWALGVVRLDLGHSFHFNAPVAPLVARAAINTAILGLSALIVATALGVALGIFTGSARGPLPALVRATSVMAVSMPPLLTTLALVFVAARTGWLPTGNMTSPAAMDMSRTGWLLDVAYHLILPVLALALPMAATFERLQSQAIAEALEQPFVTAAAARGLSHRQIVLRHAWRVSLRPLCGVYGIAIGTLLSGSFVVEYILVWPGLGRLMRDALFARDIYLVAGCAAAGAALLAIGTLIGDVLLAAVDPRVREG